MIELARPLPLVLLLATPTLAQRVERLAGVGDVTPNSGTVVGVEALSTAGVLHYVLLGTDHPIPSLRQVLRGWPTFSKVYYEFGLYGISGRPVDRVRGVANDRNGSFAVVGEGPDADLLPHGGPAWQHLLAFSGGIIAGTGFPAGATYAALRWVDIEQCRFTLRGVLADPASGQRAFLSRGRIGISGFRTHKLVIAEGDPVPVLGLPLASLSDRPHGVALDENGGAGGVAWVGEVDAGTGLRWVAFVGSDPVALEGDPSPVPGRRWGAFPRAAVEMNFSGEWTLVAGLDASDPASAPVILRNGEVWRRAGDLLPSVAPRSLTGFGHAPARLWDDGHALWYATLDDPDPARDEVLFLDRTALIREGETRLHGRRVVGFGPGVPVYDTDPMGPKAIVRVVLSEAGEVALRLDLDVGELVCTGGLNSLGLRARLSLAGLPWAARGALSARTSRMPAGEPVVLLADDEFLTVPFGNTQLCLAAGPLRLAVGQSDGSGSVAFDLDLARLGSVVPGDQWYFQLWYRDTAGAPDTNLSSAVRLTFE